MLTSQLGLDVHHELIIDNFAGGGASCGIEMGLGRSVDAAINHDPEAVAMHAMNHLQARHYCESVWDVDPLEVTQGRPVGLAWFSPDCKHFSKAKGGKPCSKKIRGLAWIVLRWAALVRPRVIMLENVEEFRTWGPLLGDGRPCPRRKGITFRSFIHQLQEKGYAVEYREMRACDYGAPTIRKRLFLIARCDGKPVIWPEPTHGAPTSAEVKAKQRKPWRTAAKCIDWALPCPSSSSASARWPNHHAADRAPHALGIAAPYLVGAGGPEYAGKPKAADVPFNTLTTENHTHLVSAFLAKHFGGNYTGPGADLIDPAHTATATDHHALVAAQLVGCGGRAGQSRPRDAGEPTQTLTTKADTCIVTSNLAKLRNNQFGQDSREPMPTITAGGGHVADVRAFLVKYYSEAGQDQDCRDPMHTIPTNDRLGLVTVAGEQYQIADIGMRMLEPHELYAAQGFPASYIIAPEINGRRLPKHAQVRMCGNSVSPPLAAALVQANVPEMMAWTKKQAKQQKVAA